MMFNPPPAPLSIDVYSGPVETMPAASVDYLGKYAQVTNLFGIKVDRVLCTGYLISGAMRYYWEPLRPASPNVVPVSADQNIVLMPLLSPTMLRLTGAPTGNRTITADKTRAHPGLTYDIKMDGLLNLFTVTIAGLALGNTLGLLGNSSRKLVFDGTDYQAF